MPSGDQSEIHDIFVIGGGINGCGIARDAAGRGLSVVLAEMDDLGGATSSASTKLFHGGLRYLEFFEFRLVQKALKEREVLLKAMPHISWPMRFVLPLDPEMRFPQDTPTSRVLGLLMPWLKGRRPNWLIRLGLFLYDNLGGRKILPATSKIDLTSSLEGLPLQERLTKAYEYSDCWVQDARLVVLCARDAQERGAQILTRSKVVGATRKDDHWTIDVENKGEITSYRARALVNAGGPWVSEILKGVVRLNSPDSIRLVRGSHIVTKRLFDHEKGYFFQGADGRIIFAIPYEEDFTLIGTTDQDHDDLGEAPACSPEEAEYLRAFASQYFKTPIQESDIVWTYSGVRPLYDDGASSATAATRDYVLRLDENGAPLVSVFGGKITTFRKLAEATVQKLEGAFPRAGSDWTANSSLPGGDFPVAGVRDLNANLIEKFPFLKAELIKRLVRCYGTDVWKMLEGVQELSDMGQSFGAHVFEKELNWVVDKEWVQTGEDFLWRRTKLGLRTTPEEAQKIDAYVRKIL